MADSTNLLSGKLKIVIKDTDLLDGKVAVQSKDTDLLDGLMYVYDDVTDILDGKIRMHDGSVSLAESDKKKIAFAVWERDLDQHKITGSFGLKINKALRFFRWLGFRG